MKRFLSLSLASVVLALGLVSCGAPVNPLSTMIPDDVLAFAQIENPNTFISNLDEVVAKLELKDLLGGQTLRETMKGLKENSMGMFDPAWLDLNRPLGVAALPASDPSNVGVLVFIPVTNKEGGDGIANISAMTGAKAIQASGYTVLQFNSQAEITFPVAKALDLARVSSYEDGGISWYLNFESAKKAFGYDREMISKNLSESAGYAFDPATARMGVEGVKGLLDILEAANSSTAGLLYNKDVAFLRGDFSFNEGQIRTLLGEFKAAPADLSYFKFVPETALLSAVGDMGENKEAITKVAVAISEWAFGLFLEDKTLLTEYIQLIKDSMTTVGSRFAFSFDLDFDAEKFQAAASSQDIDGLFDNLQLKFLGVAELKDAAAYMSYMDKVYSSDFMDRIGKSIMSTMGADSPLEDINISYKFEKDLKDGDFVYSQMKISASGFGSSVETAKMLDKLYSKMTMVMHVSKDNLYYTLGESNLPFLKEVVKNGKISGNTLDKKASFQKVLGLMPKDASLIGNFSLARVFELVKKGGAPDSVPALDIASSGWTSFFKIDKAMLEGGLAVSMDDIKVIVAAASELSSLFGMGNNSYDSYESEDWSEDDMGMGDYEGDYEDSDSGEGEEWESEDDESEM